MLNRIKNDDFYSMVTLHQNWINTRQESIDSCQLKLVEKEFASLELHEKDLSDAVLTRCRFIECKFTHCDFTGINFMYSVFERCIVSHSELRKTDLHSAICIGMDLEHCGLTQAELHDTNLMYANLSNCDLRGAELISVDLRYANLENVNLDYARSSHAKIYNTSKFKPHSINDFSIGDAFIDFWGTGPQKSGDDAISYLFDI